MVESIQGLNITTEEKEAIFSKNALKLLGL
jgi:predicted TIM-barrel fold metal-dependent hydrolase